MAGPQVAGERPRPVGLPVLRADEPTVLEYVWGDDLLRWELTPTDRGTRLTLLHTTAQRSGVPMMAAGRALCLDGMAHLGYEHLVRLGGVGDDARRRAHERLAGRPMGEPAGRAAADEDGDK